MGRTVRDTLNLIYELSERGIGVRNLADPIKVDSSRPDDPMAQLAVVLALFAQMERTYALKRAAHAGATANGRRVGRSVVVAPAKLEWTAHLRESGHTIAARWSRRPGSLAPASTAISHRPAPAVRAYGGAWSGSARWQRSRVRVGIASVSGRSVGRV